MYYTTSHRCNKVLVVLSNSLPKKQILKFALCLFLSRTRVHRIVRNSDLNSFAASKPPSCLATPKQAVSAALPVAATYSRLPNFHPIKPCHGRREDWVRAEGCANLRLLRVPSWRERRQRFWRRLRQDPGARCAARDRASTSGCRRHLQPSL